MGIFGFGKKKATTRPQSAWDNTTTDSPTPGLGPTQDPTPPPNPNPPPNPPQKPPQYTEPDNNNYDYQDQGPPNVGHEGSYNGQSREQWRDAWMSSGTKNQAGTDAWLSQNGATKLAGNGTFLTPFGEVLDLGQNYRTGVVTPAWTRVDQAPPPGYGGADGYSSGPSYNPNMNGMSPGFSQGVDPALLSAFQDYLANQNKPPEVAPRVQPHSGAQPIAKRAFDPRSMTSVRQRY